MTKPVALDVTTRRGRERVREVFTGRKVSSLTPEEIERARAAGYEPGSDGWLIGRDPREMTQDELRAMRHEPMTPMEVIRAKCLDCCAGSAHEVRCCVAMACPSWPLRMGKNVWRAVSEGRREAGRRLAARLHGKLPEGGSDLGSSDEELQPSTGPTRRGY